MPQKQQVGTTWHELAQEFETAYRDLDRLAIGLIDYPDAAVSIIVVYVFNPDSLLSSLDELYSDIDSLMDEVFLLLSIIATITEMAEPPSGYQDADLAST